MSNFTSGSVEPKFSIPSSNIPSSNPVNSNRAREVYEFVFRVWKRGKKYDSRVRWELPRIDLRALAVPEPVCKGAYTVKSSTNELRGLVTSNWGYAEPKYEFLVRVVSEEELRSEGLPEVLTDPPEFPHPRWIRAWDRQICAAFKAAGSEPAERGPLSLR